LSFFFVTPFVVRGDKALPQQFDKQFVLLTPADILRERTLTGSVESHPAAIGLQAAL
jgi:hypothetical protein